MVIRFSVILFLFFFCSNSFGQDLVNCGITNRISGKGEINCTTEIIMLLDFIPRAIYKDGCLKASSEQIVGHCNIDNSENITLIGERVISTPDMYADEFTIVKDSITLFAFDNEMNKMGLFSGYLRDSIFTSTWNDKSGKSVCQIDFNSNRFSTLVLKNDNQEFTPLSKISQGYNQAQYELIKSSDIDDMEYLLLKLTEPCCGLYNCRGGCGGHQTVLKLCKIDQGDIVNCTEEILEAYCRTEMIESNIITSKAEELKIRVVSMSKSYDIYVDLNRLDKGLKKIMIK